MEELQELQEMREELNSRIVSVNRDAEEILLDLQPYSYLWKEEPDSVIKSLTANPEDALGNVPQIIEQIRNCETLRTQITENVQTFRLVKEWLRVDQANFKDHLLSCVDDWQKRFKDLVLESVCRCLYDLDAFCTDTETELNETVTSAPTTEQMDSATLLKVITRIQAVQDRRTTTDDMFKPLASAIKFLKTECYEELDAQVQVLQQSLPEQWLHTKKLSEQWRQQISTPMAKEASCVRMQVTSFSSKQIQFRELFRKSSAFHRDCPMPAVDMLDKLRKDIQALQEEVQELTKSGKLFEVRN
ncbi:dynein beta chain, ciliary [Trichonephila clavata]|uniref:Dynein beta chain, ciliary n=1 Tax=Trichonephila clavata TaxID=2740835 RepID=A0A8X6FS45_TRICU|nr:dynein beta chain, ciliary [Trichonephila clavata]GFR00434.1 dynein beta chain, ciliary [Trichonephila clavata]